jgi:predicted TIM-barrel fold metal-dependent hydrolase
MRASSSPLCFLLTQTIVPYYFYGMKKTFLFFALFLLVSCNQKQIKTSEAELALPLSFPVIDAHTHFHSKELNNYKQPSPQILAEFKDAGVSGAVVHFSASENFGAEVNRKSKHQWITCMGLHPGDSVKKVEKGITEGRFQCLKVYLGYVPKWANDPFYLPFYKLAERKKIPVVFHTGDTYDKKGKVKYADPLQIDEIAVDYPKVKFVIAHVGNPWFNSAAEVVYKNDNVYVDVSGLLLGDVSEVKPEELEELVIKPLRWVYAYVENPKKFLFGSDWPLVKIRPYIELMKRTIPEKDWKGFFSDNAREVFGFKPESN